jgi:crotonobetainyl-CoA:carnitine CoA-transferase CaiB-like acyl-CoA transferase
MSVTIPSRPAPYRRPACDRLPPLHGLKVVDFSRLFAGPLCTMTLGDFGADVIKVESPAGDEARTFGPPWLGGEGMNFMALNRNKRSLVLDLKHDSGREIARRLCAEADVVIENFRPGVAERLGIGHDDLAAANPGLVYCSVSGFGRYGPQRDRAALDLVLQGAAGVMDRQGGGDAPSLLVITVADCYGAALATQGILAALLARVRDGLGQQLEVTLFQALLAAQSYRIISPATDVPELPAWQDVAPYQAFRTADGWVTVAVVTDRSWQAFCSAVALDDLREDPRFATNPARVENQAELLALLTPALEQYSTDVLLDLLDASGVPCGRVKRVEDLFFDEHVLANGLIVEVEHPTAGRIWTLGLPVQFAGTPGVIDRPAPLRGQHTDQVLAELGYDPAAIAHLRASGACQ